MVKESLPEDAGAYTCLIENRAGKTSCCAAVFVRGQLLEGIPADLLFTSTDCVSYWSTDSLGNLHEKTKIPHEIP